MLERLSKARGIWCALPLLVSASHPVAAHSPIQGLGVFYNAMLHPFLEPVHFLLLIGVGLLLGRQRRRIAGTGVAALLFGFLYEGGSQLALWTKIPKDLITVIQALVILFTGALPYLVRRPLERLFLMRKRGVQ